MEASPYLVFNEESATVAVTDDQYFQLIPVAFNMEHMLLKAMILVIMDSK